TSAACVPAGSVGRSDCIYPVVFGLTTIVGWEPHLPRGFSADVDASSRSVSGAARARAGEKKSIAARTTAAAGERRLHLNMIALLLAACAARTVCDDAWL